MNKPLPELPVVEIADFYEKTGLDRDEVKKLIKYQEMHYADISRQLIHEEFQSFREEMNKLFRENQEKMDQRFWFLNQKMDQGFQDVRNDLRTEIQSVRDDVRADIGSLRGDISKLQGNYAHHDKLFYVLLAVVLLAPGVGGYVIALLLQALTG